MRIRTRIIGAALLVVVIANVVYTGYFIRKERSEAIARLQTTVDATNRLLDVVNAGPLYDGNVEQLKANLDSFFRNPDLLAITLSESGGDIRVSRTRALPNELGQRIESRVDVTRGIDKLGEISTVYTTNNIEQRLRESRNELMLFSVALATGLLIVIFFVTRGLTRPVERLTTAAQAMADGKLDQEIDARGAQELAILGRSFIRMRDAIHQKMADLAENNRRLNQEIVQRRDAEQERDRLVSILEATTDIVSMADPSGRLLYLNRAGRAMLGMAPGPMLESVIPDVHPAWAAELVLQLGLPAAIRDGVWSGETALVGPGGTEAPVSQVILSHKDAQGNLLYLSTIMRDISERKQAEQALKRLNEELEHRVEQRTAEMAAARDEAERANHAKSEFLSRMSHELRTPMNAILGFGQLLEIDKQIAGSQRQWAREIVRGGHHLLDLINEVLDLARVESGKFSVSPEPVALLPLIQECLMLVRPQAAAHDLRLLDAARHCDVHAHADRTRLKQVLLNLLSNAVKYNRAQGTVSVVCAATHDGPAPSVHIRVSDTGTGLTPEQRARLFVPFERLNADQHQIEGTGLGLALSKRLVELMGGAIGVESTPGLGSTFWVRLPLANGHDVDAAAAPPGAATKSEAPAAMRSVDVLCIEDNPANLRLIEGVLARRPGIRLLSAIAPGLGLELARMHRPALILLDINLPDMDGYAVMQCLRENEATRDIPVVAISANAMPRDLERGKAAGFVDYLTKPIDLQRFLAVVDRLLVA
jgi:PAS domain S-box-containing protein